MSNAESRTAAFTAARDLLLQLRSDHDEAQERFSWPQPAEFNWALDWFDALGTRPDRRDQVALRIVEEDGSEQQWTFSQLAARTGQVANWLRAQGVGRGDRVIVMLGNQIELWEMVLAIMKLGAVLIPATTLLGPADLRDRVDRGRARVVVVTSADTGKFDEVPGDYTRICVGAPVAGWLSYSDSADAAGEFSPDGVTRSTDTLLLYFTSGTTSQPKLVEHTHASYPIGHLSTMYWIGVQPGDVHLNISSPGWAKHAWSNVFAPWNAEATVLIYNYRRFDPAALLEQVRRCEVTTFCAPPTVWRMLIQGDLGSPGALSEVVGAGEPLNPEIIEQVRDGWGLTIRDGFGQTETTAVVGNSPGQLLRPGSMGRPLPGYRVELIDPVSGIPGAEGEICLPLDDRPLGLMTGYRDDADRTAGAMREGYYHTGDVASRDADGYITYVGRADDVFKASDYRISPFELESVLLEHSAVAEAAVVPAPDPLRTAVPKAYVTLAEGWAADDETALDILRYCRGHLSPFKRVRRLEFGTLPKTVSGKIRRVELRQREEQPARPEGEFREEDFPELKG